MKRFILEILLIFRYFLYIEERHVVHELLWVDWIVMYETEVGISVHVIFAILEHSLKYKKRINRKDCLIMLKLQILKSAFSPKNSNVALSLHTAGKQIEKRVF